MDVWIFFLQKHIDLLQEALIHPLGAMFSYGWMRLDYFWTVEQKHPPNTIRTQIFNRTPIGFIWKKKII